jgi:ABC-type bacteriocin/lantibiotic exporter with double-glycine peptidase domain
VRCDGVHPSSPLTTPELRQADAAECGVVALGILMRHHGRHLTLPELRERLGGLRLVTLPPKCPRS